MSEITPEQLTTHQWNKAIENTLIKTGYGLAIGGISSFIFFRATPARAAFIGLAAGVGIGMSFVENKSLFTKKD